MSPSSKVWRLPKDIDTDNLAPGAYMKLPIAQIAKHTLESIRADFAGGVKPGDVIVAGPNFGIGSSREQAAGVLVELGVRAVIAPSFSGLFFRNAFNLGLLLLTCAQAGLINEEETLQIEQQMSDLSSNEASSGTHEGAHEGVHEGANNGAVHTFHIVAPSGLRLECKPIPDFLMQMIDHGGLLNVLKYKYKQN